MFHGNKKEKFNLFYEKFYNCSQEFQTPEDLKNASLSYDILLTGSDQVWNPMHTEDDLSFLLSFCADNTPKISYASSFSKSVLPDEYKEVYAKHLKKYKHISVRENSGINIVHELTGKMPFYACDPTLLLSKKAWTDLALQGEHLVKGKYILLYILTYAYNPYPEILNIIEYVKNKVNLPVVILDGSLCTNKIEGAQNIKCAGPLEFLRLIKDADFIITTSFHGTAFSLNFERPFISVLSNNSKSDTRILDLLKVVNAKDRALVYNCSVNDISLDMDYNIITPKVEMIRKESYEYLKMVLKDCTKNMA